MGTCARTLASHHTSRAAAVTVRGGGHDAPWEISRKIIVGSFWCDTSFGTECVYGFLRLDRRQEEPRIVLAENARNVRNAFMGTFKEQIYKYSGVLRIFEGILRARKNVDVSVNISSALLHGTDCF